jgi:GNAT superfamily N-acetyltransferase
MLRLIRFDSGHPDFRILVKLLDKELAERDGGDHSFYAQFNTIDTIKEVIVAYVDEQPVGCGAIKPFEEGVAEVKRMYVLPSFRGQHIAGEILGALERWAAELGNTFCVLETGKKQPEAIRLYERSGYQYIPNYGQYEGVVNSVCFKKALLPTSFMA